MRMRAYRIHENGPPEQVLHLEQTEVPLPGPGQVQLQVVLASMNFPDDLMARGTYQERPPLPFTPGLEVLGLVTAVGEGVDMPLGTRVVALTAAPAGGFAEYALADVLDAFPVPASVPDEAAASMLITYQTSHVALHHRAALKAGEVLLVHAAAGGVGSSAVQLGKAAGARVIATAGGPDKAEVCRRLGADVVIDYLAEDLVARVKEETGGAGADVVYDPVGGDVFDASRRCVAWEGRILVIGFAGGRIADLPTNHVLLKNYSVVGVHWGAYKRHDRRVMHDAHADLVRLYGEGLLDPLIDRVVPLEQTVEALQRVTGRSTVGKVLVRP